MDTTWAEASKVFETWAFWPCAGGGAEGGGVWEDWQAAAASRRAGRMRRDRERAGIDSMDDLVGRWWEERA
jgi:hypothetical protein